MTGFDRIRRPLATYLWLALGVWALLVAVATVELLLTGAFEAGNAIATAMRDWLPWVVLVPAVVWLARRFPLEHGKLWIGITVHVSACSAVVVLSGLLARPPPRLPRPGWANRPADAFRRVGQDSGVWQQRPPAADHAFPYAPRDGPPPGRPSFHFMWQLQRARLEVPIYWLIVSVVHALAFHRRSRERELKAVELSASLTRARLQALHMQLRPHFLFNTLNAISALIHKDPQAADDMVAELSELLRITLDGSGPFETPLHRELEVLDCYFRIERRRFGERLQIREQIEPEVANALVPTLLLQPLAENAMRYGVGMTTRPVQVTIAARRSGRMIELRVEDNGPGLKEGAVRGIGLTNTSARLAELYGAAGVLKIDNAPGGGGRAIVQIPFHTEPVAIATTSPL